jgi:hypothetical protein
LGLRGMRLTELWRKLHNKDLHANVLLTHYCVGDKIEKHEIGGPCSAYGGKMRVQGFGG